MPYFYKNKTPSIGSIVFVKLNTDYPIRDNDVGIYMNMIEYNNLEGLVLCTEIFKYKVNLQTFFKPNKVYPMLVLSNDENKYDLSYIKVKLDMDFVLDCYKYLQLIVDIVVNINPTELIYYDTIHRILNKSMLDNCITEKKNLYKDLYKNILLEPTILFQNSKFYEKEIEDLKKRIVIKNYEIFYDFKLIIYENKGSDTLKNTLTSLDEYVKIISDNNNELDIKLICKSSPIYTLRIKELTKDLCITYAHIVFTKLNHLLNNISHEFNKLDITVINESDIYLL